MVTNPAGAAIRPITGLIKPQSLITHLSPKGNPVFSLSGIRPYTGNARYVVSFGGSGIRRFLEEYEGSGGLDLDPDFQRGHVWTDALRTRYIEHLLRRGEHGRMLVWSTPLQDALALASTPDRDLSDALVLVDGKQRLTAILGFLDDKVEVFGGRRLS